MFIGHAKTRKVNPHFSKDFSIGQVLISLKTTQQMMREKPEKKKKPKKQPKPALSPECKSQLKKSFREFAHEFLLLPDHFQPTNKEKPQERLIKKKC
jgi:hypothetical protein